MDLRKHVDILLFPPLGVASGVGVLLVPLHWAGPIVLYAMLGVAGGLAVVATGVLDHSLRRGVANVLSAALGAFGLFVFLLALPGD
ncbi:hypothetical protein ACH9L7_01215 [Haloferax sp. S1W]|uniref:hypothetical protein n=1 Tax=Haloferax sp. S1W TaxID=3377110 RepID=UPI0037C841D8